MADAMTKVNTFRAEFKRYKQRKPPPDLSDIIDFENENTWKGMVKESDVFSKDIIEQDLQQFGLKSLNKWKCYELFGYQGFKVIVNPFTSNGLLKWIKQCVEVYPCKPNVCNLDAHMELKDEDNLWKDYENSQSNQPPEDLQQNSNSKTKTDLTLMDQLRWVTLGYHYNWDTKLYSKNNFTLFPDDLGNLIKCIAKAIGYPKFVPEAAIVNYYHMDSTLSGHTDHSELDLTAPLFSMSFGQTCIFLLGSQSLEDIPSAMFLRNGDIVIMANDTRLSYHAVPRILPNQDISQITTINKDDETLTKKRIFLGNYLSYSRINVNIRQVEGPGGCFEAS